MHYILNTEVGVMQTKALCALNSYWRDKCNGDFYADPLLPIVNKTICETKFCSSKIQHSGTSFLPV